MSNPNQSRRITLTDQGPIVILEGQWPIVARSTDGDTEEQWGIFVRQHADGRRLVYGFRKPDRTRTDTDPLETIRAGWLVPSLGWDHEAGATLRGNPDNTGTVAAIRRVAAAIRDSALGESVTDDLPPQPLT